MSLKGKDVRVSGGVEQLPIEPGVYPARLVQVIDLGLQDMSSERWGKKRPANKIWLTWELVNEFCKDENGNDIEDKPRWVSDQRPWYGIGADKAPSAMYYKAMDPKNEYDEDFGKLVGKPCLVTVVNNEKNGKVYTNVAGVTPPMKGMQIPELVNEPKVLDLDAPDMEVFESLPDFLKDIIKSNLEYNGSMLQHNLGETSAVDQMDDVPFGSEEVETPF